MLLFLKFNKVKLGFVVVLLTVLLWSQTTNSVEALTVNTSEAEATLYVAPSATNESSNTNCSLVDPCTLEGARDKARTLLASMNGDIDIYLRGGTYTLSRILPTSPIPLFYPF